MLAKQIYRKTKQMSVDFAAKKQHQTEGKLAEHDQIVDFSMWIVFTPYWTTSKRSVWRALPDKSRVEIETEKLI